MTFGRGLRARLLVVVAMLIGGVGCVESAPRNHVTIFAASSMQTVINALVPAFEASTGTEVRVSYAASSALARQIENGAPADIFISADEDWMQHVDDLGQIQSDSRVSLAGNRLVLVAPASHPQALSIAAGFPLAATLGDGRLAVANPASVPAGKYARAALESLGVWTSVESHLAPAENVRAALLLVSRAEAPLGIVYRTDAIADPSVTIVDTFPASLHPAIVYPGALTTNASPSASAVLRFLTGPHAQEEFARQGFTPDPGPGTSNLGPRTSDLGPETTIYSVVSLSLKVALVAVVLSAPFAIVIAVALARGRFWGRSLLNALVHLPLVLPPVVTGYALLRVFGRQGMVGAWLEDSLGLVFAFRWTGAALAAAVMGFPLMVRAIRLAVEGVDRHLEEAASTLGASPVWTLMTVTLPLALPGVLAGMVLSFAKALGEFGATIMFVSNIPGETQTLALAIFSLVEQPGADAAVVRLVWISIGVSMSALLVSEWLARRVTRRSS